MDHTLTAYKEAIDKIIKDSYAYRKACAAIKQTELSYLYRMRDARQAFIEAMELDVPDWAERDTEAYSACRVTILAIDHEVDRRADLIPMELLDMWIGGQQFSNNL